MRGDDAEYVPEPLERIYIINFASLRAPLCDPAIATFQKFRTFGKFTEPGMKRKGSFCTSKCSKIYFICINECANAI